MDLTQVNIVSGIVDYGALGLFVAYLVYDRHFLITKMVKAIDRLSAVIQDLDKDIIQRQ